MTKSAFILSAGFGTRFQPHTNFLPKPALPFFNLPQVLYPTGLLREAGVSDFFYNSHHLSQQLDSSLEPFFNRKSIFEKELLDSAGGIANSKDFLSTEEDFWVVNGDSFITTSNSSILNEAYDFHKKTNSIATLVGIKKKDPSLNGLGFSPDNVLTHTAKGLDTLHFVGLYLFNKEIFNYIQAKPSHILKDVLLNNFHERVSVFNAGSDLTWFETGNEIDFITCHKIESKNLLKNMEQSSVYKTAQIWKQNPEKKMNQFLEKRIWGEETSHSNSSEFLILPDNFSGKIKNLKNCVIATDTKLPDAINFENRFLINSSQWA